ncbi:hypothetical protein DIPPA_31417 [Diplonema papillatum]|nr:hypothetical protein DIPPA_31417 [Diplonema papillatum]
MNDEEEPLVQKQRALTSGSLPGGPPSAAADNVEGKVPEASQRAAEQHSAHVDGAESDADRETTPANKELQASGDANEVSITLEAGFAPTGQESISAAAGIRTQEDREEGFHAAERTVGSEAVLSTHGDDDGDVENSAERGYGDRNGEDEADGTFGTIPDNTSASDNAGDRIEMKEQGPQADDPDCGATEKNEDAPGNCDTFGSEDVDDDRPETKATAGTADETRGGRASEKVEVAAGSPSRVGPRGRTKAVGSPAAAAAAAAKNTTKVTFQPCSPQRGLAGTRDENRGEDGPEAEGGISLAIPGRGDPDVEQRAAGVLLSVSEAGGGGEKRAKPAASNPAPAKKPRDRQAGINGGSGGKSGAGRTRRPSAAGLKPALSAAPVNGKLRAVRGKMMPPLLRRGLVAHFGLREKGAMTTDEEYWLSKPQRPFNLNSAIYDTRRIPTSTDVEGCILRLTAVHAPAATAANPAAAGANGSGSDRLPKSLGDLLAFSRAKLGRHTELLPQQASAGRLAPSSSPCSQRCAGGSRPLAADVARMRRTADRAAGRPRQGRTPPPEAAAAAPATPPPQPRDMAEMTVPELVQHAREYRVEAAAAAAAAGRGAARHKALVSREAAKAVPGAILAVAPGMQRAPVAMPMPSAAASSKPRTPAPLFELPEPLQYARLAPRDMAEMTVPELVQHTREYRVEAAAAAAAAGRGAARHKALVSREAAKAVPGTILAVAPGMQRAPVAMPMPSAAASSKPRTPAPLFELPEPLQYARLAPRDMAEMTVPELVQHTREYRVEAAAAAAAAGRGAARHKALVSREAAKAVPGAILAVAPGMHQGRTPPPAAAGYGRDDRAGACAARPGEAAAASAAAAALRGAARHRR